MFFVDLRNFNKLKKYLNNIKPDLIFHLASNADVRGSFDNPVEHASNNKDYGEFTGRNKTTNLNH